MTEQDYERSVTGLEKAWASRIEMHARIVVDNLKLDFLCDDNASGIDRESLQLEATEAVSARLLDSEQWANVKATDISDLAYEAVQRVLDGQS